MLDVLTFTFSNGWHFAGVSFLWFGTLAVMTEGIRGMRK